jgi:hypothetical protein
VLAASWRKAEQFRRESWSLPHGLRGYFVLSALLVIAVTTAITSFAVEVNGSGLRQVATCAFPAMAIATLCYRAGEKVLQRALFEQEIDALAERNSQWGQR